MLLPMACCRTALHRAARRRHPRLHLRHRTRVASDVEPKATRTRVTATATATRTTTRSIRVSSTVASGGAREVDRERCATTSTKWRRKRLHSKVAKRCASGRITWWVVPARRMSRDQYLRRHSRCASHRRSLRTWPRSRFHKALKPCFRAGVTLEPRSMRSRVLSWMRWQLRTQWSNSSGARASTFYGLRARMASCNNQPSLNEHKSYQTWLNFGSM